MSRLIGIIGFLAALSVLAGPAAAEERIISFVSDVTIAADGELTVIETIKVRAEGRQIKRGIYRDFPTIYKELGGGSHVVGFELVETLRDGRPVNHWTESVSNGVRIYMGDKDRYLPQGSYTYRLTYRTDRQIGLFETFDELYWNVTGNGWIFPIDYAAVTIHLPEGATVVRKAAYTGPQDAKGIAWSYGTDDNGNPMFATTSRLRAREGLTVAVAFPKGFVTPPDPLEEAEYFLRDNLVYLVGAGGFGLLMIYYLVAWFRIGRDPPTGTIVPRWKAPAGISPAAARYVRRMDFDKKALGAAVVDLAVKGHLTIEENGRNAYRLNKRTAPVQSRMSPGEKAFKQALFRWGDVATVEKGNHERLKPAVDALRRALSAGYEGAHFSRNVWVIFVGIFLTVAVAAATFFVGANVQDDRLVFLLIGMAGGGVGLSKLFTWLIKAPTMKGRRLMDEIEGFRMYLGTAEQHRLNLLHPPERTPELFERYLPYAMALDVENEWGDQFKDVLAAAATGGDGEYSPAWYHGRHWHSHNPGRFASSIGSSLGGAIASAATPPGSSSGSGGGGSSGGGGGGGGGGGF